MCIKTGRHTERKALFLGDYVDRGPDIPEVYKIVRSMVEGDAALAITGNIMVLWQGKGERISFIDARNIYTQIDRPTVSFLKNKFKI